MKINNTELLRLGTVKRKPKTPTKLELILSYLEKNGETPEKELDVAINGHGHFAELMRSLVHRKKVKASLCMCKETTLYKLVI